MENQLGRSIVRAAWILAGALIICMVIWFAGKDRYTPLATSPSNYIDQNTGQVYPSYKPAK